MRLGHNSGALWVGTKKPALAKRVCVRLGYGLGKCARVAADIANINGAKARRIP